MKKTNLFYGWAFLLLLYFACIYSGFVKFIDYKIYDYSKKIVSLYEKERPSSVVIVDIDERSLETLGQWPWSRVLLAQLVKTLQKEHPASIGIDILFPEKDKTSPKEIASFYQTFFSTKVKFTGLEKNLYDNDKVFSEVLKNSNVVLPLYLNSLKDYKNCIYPKQLQDIHPSQYLFDTTIMCSIPLIEKSAKNLGFINANNDSDGILRRVALFRKYNDMIIPSFALANLMSVDKLNIQGNKLSILDYSFKIGQDSFVMLNFYKNEHYESVSALDVLLGKVPLQKLQGKFVLIGTSALGLYDKYTINSSQVLPGVFVHATFIDNVLNNDVIYPLNSFKTWNILFSFLCSFILFLLIVKKEYLYVAITFLFVSFIILLGNFYALAQNIYLFSGYFLAPFAINFFFMSLFLFLLAYKEKKEFYESLTKAHSSTLDSMALVVETRDVETGAHIKRTKEYVKILADYLHRNGQYKGTLSKRYRQLLYRAAPLHDIGKVGIPDAILKKPARFTPQEFEVMKTHTTIGKNILENAMKENEDNDFLKIAYNIAYYHHEKWDGSGYPCGLEKNEIPLEARLMALSDVYDALISRRCYKEEFSFEESEKIIIDGKGTHFEPFLVEAFIALKEEFRNIALNIQE